MERLQVLIVEDELMIAMDVEGALIEAGYDVAGIAASQVEALGLAQSTHPDCAVVDVSLRPGDGRIVARAFAQQGIAVLFATGQCQDVKELADTGALGCLPKPYSADDVPAALQAICERRLGHKPGRLPDSMFLLNTRLT